MESNGKKIVKQECLDEVWERVELRMRMQGISQTRLVELCKEAGYMITQPEIEKTQEYTVELFREYVSDVWAMINKDVMREGE